VLASSETEPAIRHFARDGVELGALPVPDRFRVAPAGEATTNLTLEGLGASPDGRDLWAAMEGPPGRDGTTADGRARRASCTTSAAATATSRRDRSPTSPIPRSA
jgi:hypothetical protein